MIAFNFQYSFAPSIIMVGQFPPPVNGFSFITQEMARALAVNHETTIVDLAPHVPRNGVSYHFRRLLLALKGFWPLLRGSINKNRRLYIACEGGLGLVYTIMLCAVVRVLGFPVYMHHHSFAYIEDFSNLMAFLLRVLGQHAIHIFLCPVMAQHFARRYNRTVKCIIISNSAFVDEVFSAPHSWQAGKPLVIGLLSNLNEEKGLGLFLDVLRGAASEGLNINGVLAGPLVTDNDREYIAAARHEFGDRLDYRGPVYGEAKAVFFRSIDVFVFPTRYVNEAQPTVIFEAMAYGLPILSYDRGCIKGQVGGCGAVLERNGDFIPFALNWLKAQMNSPRTLEQLKLDAKVAFLEDRAQAKQSVGKLFEFDPLVIHPSLD